MGCDIHLHTEIKAKGVWHHYSHPHVRRNYALFAKMADVRNDGTIEPIALPRGLPNDMSVTTKLDIKHWDADGHSHSWLTGDELEEVANWLTKYHREHWPKEWFDCHHELLGYFFGNGWRLIPEERGRSYPEEIEAVRAVFWFDN